MSGDQIVENGAATDESEDDVEGLENEPQTTQDAHGAKNSIEVEDENLLKLSLEQQLQHRYQVAVIHSYDVTSSPAPKGYPLAQKETAAKLYDLCHEGHFLSLKLKHMQKMHDDAVRVLEQKWISTVAPRNDEIACDDISEELRFWHRQMMAYEKKYNEACRSCQGMNKFEVFGGQLCFNTSWKQEAFQECLEFCTENKDHNLKVVINFDGEEFGVECSMYLEGLRKVVEQCFASKSAINDLVRKIWQLFETTFYD